EIIQNGQNSPHAVGVGKLENVRLLPLGTAAEIVEFRLAAQQAIQQLVILFNQAVAFGSDRLDRLRGGSARGRVRRPVYALDRRVLTVLECRFFPVHTSSLFHFQLISVNMELQTVKLPNARPT